MDVLFQGAVQTETEESPAGSPRPAQTSAVGRGSGLCMETEEGQRDAGRPGKRGIRVFKREGGPSRVHTVHSASGCQSDPSLRRWCPRSHPTWWLWGPQTPVLRRGKDKIRWNDTHLV